MQNVAASAAFAYDHLVAAAGPVLEHGTKEEESQP